MKWLRRALVVGVALALMPFVMFAGYGWANNYDVLSGIRHLFEPTPQPLADHSKIPSIPQVRVSWLADIRSRELDESSGLAASQRVDNLLWSINDSGGEPELHALNLRGEDLGRWRVDVDRAVDWEALASFRLDGRSYLMIADVGDNFRWRRRLTLWVVEEPELETHSTVPLPIAWQIEYQYPDGPRDCEAVAVDEISQTVYLLSKRRYPAEVFVLPLQADEVVTAKRIAQLTDLPRPSLLDKQEQPNSWMYRHMPSGMDIRHDLVLITTYQDAYLYTLGFDATPLRIALPTIGQREAIAFARQRADLAYITKERADGVGVADLFQIELPTPLTTSNIDTPAAQAGDDQVGSAAHN